MCDERKAAADATHRSAAAAKSSSRTRSRSRALALCLQVRLARFRMHEKRRGDTAKETMREAQLVVEEEGGRERGIRRRVAASKGPFYAELLSPLALLPTSVTPLTRHTWPANCGWYRAPVNGSSTACAWPYSGVKLAGHTSNAWCTS